MTATLFDQPRAKHKPSIDEQFNSFIASNPHVYEWFRKYAHELRERGHERISADMICHRIRFELMIQTAGEVWRMNNNYTSRLARMLIKEDSRFAFLFELRELKSKEAKDEHEKSSSDLHC